MATARPLVISASRRTDLPGFHAEALADRLRRRVAGLRTRYLHGVVFWTRHVAPFLSGNPLHTLVRRELANPVVNLTITGLGGSDLEPGTPATEEVLRDLPALSAAFHNEPWRIRWRFDPILKSHSDVDAFRRIAETMSLLGVPTCTFSFPSYFSLKGNLRPYFDAAGIPEWTAPEKRGFLSELVKIARPLHIRLLSCAQPESCALHSAIAPAQCIPREVLEQGDPARRPLEPRRDRSQRAHCRCIESEDIGDYARDTCRGGCVYCYSKAGGPAPAAARPSNNKPA